MQLANILLAAVLSTAAVAHPTIMATPVSTNDTTISNSNYTMHTLEARISHKGWVGTYNNDGTTCQKPVAGPNPARPKMYRGECIKINRMPGFSIAINWGAEMSEQNQLSAFYDDDCKVYAKNYGKEGNKILLCDDTIKDEPRWGSFKVWVV